MYASAGGHAECVKVRAMKLHSKVVDLKSPQVLLSNGANPSVQSHHDGDTPLHKVRLQSPPLLLHQHQHQHHHHHHHSFSSGCERRSLGHSPAPPRRGCRFCHHQHRRSNWFPFHVSRRFPTVFIISLATGLTCRELADRCRRADIASVISTYTIPLLTSQLHFWF